MWVVLDDIADLITAIIYSGFLYFLLIHGVDFHRFVDMNIPGLISSLIFILLYKELSSSLLFISLNNSLINPMDKLHHTRYIGGLIYLGDLILNIVL